MNGAATGKIRIQSTNHLAYAFRDEHIATNRDTYLETLENKNNSIEVDDYVRDNELDLTKPIVETYSFKDTKDIEVINDKIYFSPLLFLASEENPFKQETREYPIDFGYPVENKYNISITVPDGYTVESLPKPLNIATGDNIGAFKYIIANEGNGIQVSIITNINAPIVTADYYDVLKDFFKQMLEKENEKIVLKKI